MIENGKQLTLQQSHEGWRRRVPQERQWTRVAPQSLEAVVESRAESLLPAATAEAAQERYDVDPLEVAATVAEWKPSTGMPSDWVVRAAVQVLLAPVPCLVWCVVARCWRLLVRPPALGCARQGSEYEEVKKGSPAEYPSWRNVLVNIQLGLLLERLFCDRVIDSLRTKLGPAQTGYIY